MANSLPTSALARDPFTAPKGLHSRIVSPPHGGHFFAMHLFTPAMRARGTYPRALAHLPTLAVRTSHDDLKSIRLYNHVEMLGEVTFAEIFDSPLPAANGRVVVSMFTKDRIRVHYARTMTTDRYDVPPKFDLTVKPYGDVLKDVVAYYAPDFKLPEDFKS